MHKRKPYKIHRQYLRKDKRAIITQWRLSSHTLNVEKGRHTSPKKHLESRENAKPVQRTPWMKIKYFYTVPATNLSE